MNDYTVYLTDNTKISRQKMKFDVIDRRPGYSSQERKLVRAEIEKQLFAVFCKYAQSD